MGTNNKTAYAVIITNPQNGQEQVAISGLDGKTMTNAVAALDLIESFKKCFPHYGYRWAPIRQKPTVMERVSSWIVGPPPSDACFDCKETNGDVCAECKRV